MTGTVTGNTRQHGQVATPPDRRLMFVAVGAMGLGVQLLVLRLLATETTMALPVSMALAVEAALLHNFVWHERWTWADRRPGASNPWLARLGRFHLTSGVVSIGGNVLLTSLFVTVAGLHYLVANVLAVAACTILNFLTADRLVFRVQEARMAGPQRRRTGMFVVCLALTTAVANAAPPQPDTVAAWHAYIEATEQRITRELESRDGFLAQDFSPSTEGSRGALKGGGIGVVRMASQDRAGASLAVPNAMVHHWRGSVFIPGTTLDEVLARVQHPSAKDLAQEDVLDARVLERGPGMLRLFLRLQRSQVVTVVYDTEHTVHYTRHAPTRASSTSVATRIVEVANAGRPDERERPAGQDRGFLWRLNSYWRYEQFEGGVIVECESISLSRTVPSVLAGTIRPLVDRVARGSMERTLSAMRQRFANE